MNCSHVIAHDSCSSISIMEVRHFQERVWLLIKIPINQSRLYVVWQCALCHVAACTISYVTVSCGSVDYVICHCIVWHCVMWQCALCRMSLCCDMCGTVSCGSVDYVICHCVVWHCVMWQCALCRMSLCRMALCRVVVSRSHTPLAKGGVAT